MSDFSALLADLEAWQIQRQPPTLLPHERREREAFETVQKALATAPRVADIRREAAERRRRDAGLRGLTLRLNAMAAGTVVRAEAMQKAMASELVPERVQALRHRALELCRLGQIGAADVAKVEALTARIMARVAR